MSRDDVLVDQARRDPDPAAALVRLLDERAPHQQGRTATSAAALRGQVLAAFATIGLPAVGVPYVLEELESGLDASTVAAAGRALCGAGPDIVAAAAPLVVAAIARLRADDDRIRFEATPPLCCGAPPLTALGDLGATLVALGPAAASARLPLLALLQDHGTDLAPAVHGVLDDAVDALAAPVTQTCCGTAPAIDTDRASTGIDLSPTLGSVGLEDQDGTTQAFAARFGGRPSAISFFYTRCPNPQRCSLTVTRLARLAERIRAAGLDLGVAAITYDPRYDRPERLRTYGADRGMAFSARCSLLRTVGPFAPVGEALALGVGFGPVTVNQHRLDLVVLDADLRVRVHRTRRQWSEDQILDDLLAAGAMAQTGGVRSKGS